MYPEIYDPSADILSGRWKKRNQEDAFQCIHCRAHVYAYPIISGVQNRNHCPYCLYSRHVDYALPGDRMSACKSPMQPIGLTMKPGRNKYSRTGSGELMLIHRCSECGKLSINRIAADDLVEGLIEIFYVSAFLDPVTRHKLTSSGIYILMQEDYPLVCKQLVGITSL